MAFVSRKAASLTSEWGSKGAGSKPLEAGENEHKASPTAAASSRTDIDVGKLRMWLQADEALTSLLDAP